MKTKNICMIVLLMVVCGASSTRANLSYDFTRQRLFPGFDGRLCKMQPTIAMDGKGTALLAYQRLLLTGSDVFY